MTPADQIAAMVARSRLESASPLVVGLCGPPGAGKSTIAAAIATGGRTATLSLDDLYLSRDARAQLAATVHPLFATRGPPGTHDVALGVATIAGLLAGKPTALPRFDKAIDAPHPVSAWPVVTAPDVIVFEGWCVGARPQPADALSAPVNDLERDADRDGAWRGFVNAQLAGRYATLFALLDRLIVLRAPDFATIVAWRQDAEGRRPAGPATMTAHAIVAFLARYERLLGWIDTDLPPRADLVLRLAADRSLE